MSLNLDDELDGRLRELSERYNTARGTIARDAIERGLKATHEALRRAARSAAREAGK